MVSSSTEQLDKALGVYKTSDAGRSRQIPLDSPDISNNQLLACHLRPQTLQKA